MAWLAGVLSGMACGAAFISFFKAIWTVGDDSDRWGGTGVVCLILCVIFGALAIAIGEQSK